jgi:hypothetical protein
MIKASMYLDMQKKRNEYWPQYLSWHPRSSCLLEAEVPLHVDERWRHEGNHGGGGTHGFHQSPVTVDFM